MTQHCPIHLDGTWRLLQRPLTDGPEVWAQVASSDQWSQAIACLVPGDVSDSLIRAGQMPEPLTGLNFQQFDWIDQRSWWLCRTFDVPAIWADLPGVTLSLDGLDYGADIWLNGTHLGTHHSAFYPFTQNVKAHLHVDQSNTLLVRLTTGRVLADQYQDDYLCGATPTEAGRGYPERGLGQRIFLRKPAYTWGWDWGPYLATCGITGQVLLKPINPVQINDVSVTTQLDGPDAIANVCVEASHQTTYTSIRADVTITFTDENGACFTATQHDVMLGSGLTHVALSCRIPRARLWWPNGSGDPHRYTLTTTLNIAGQVASTHNMKVGLRTIKLIDEPGRFAVAVNDHPIFIKGGNWIPGDCLYGRLTDAKLTTLVAEAAHAHFNCLRIWGGGRYEADAFYEACDGHGILLWHDFMSACAALPADRDWFYKAFEAEANYQIKRLRSRACLMLWCGNNEVSQCYEWADFAEKLQGNRDPGWVLYHQLLPTLIHQLAPHIPYRPTSPYGGPQSVHDPREGDNHHWLVMRPESKYWSNPWYWDTDEVPIFNSEYGIGGPCCIESTRQYLGNPTPNLFDETGRQHTNTYYDIPRVNFSIKEHYCDSENLPLEQYILLGGLCQGLNLGYSLESMRANQHTMGGIFWMYNDTWGENGWSIIDYYLRRKIAYYNVKRCLAHQRLLLRRGGQAFGGQADEILLLALNDTAQPLHLAGHWGYQSYDGQTYQLVPFEATLAPRDKTIIARIPIPASNQLAKGTIVAIPTSPSPLDPVSLLLKPYRTLNLPGDGKQAQIKAIERSETDLHVTVHSEIFAHAVHLNVPGEWRLGEWRLSDHYFDLLPGETRTIIIHDAPMDMKPEQLEARCIAIT
jgi:beta-mannosidase